MPTLSSDKTGTTIKGGIDFSNGGERGFNDALTLTAQQPRTALVIDHVLQAPSSNHAAPSTVVGGYGIDMSSDYSTAISARSSGTTPTIAAVNTGTGPAATFTGGLSAAQFRLNPGHLTTHPARGTVGDFYLDAGARLWFCKGATWKQIA